MRTKFAIIFLIFAVILSVFIVWPSWQKVKKAKELVTSPAPAWIEIKEIQEPLTLEIAPYEEPTRLYEKWKVVRDYLTEKLKSEGWKVEIKIAKNYDEVIKDVGLGTVDLAILPSVAFLEARRYYCAQPVAMPLFQGEKGIRCVLVARDEHPKLSPTYIGSPADIKGKKFVYADERSLCGTLIAHKFMRENNIVWQEGLQKVGYVQNYDAMLQAISSKDFDAGVVREPTFLEKNPPGLKVVATSERFPDLVFATTFSFDPEIRKTILKVLEEMPKEIALRMGSGYTGWKKVDDQEFDALRKLVKELHNQDYFLPSPTFCEKKPKCKLAPAQK